MNPLIKNTLVLIFLIFSTNVDAKILNLGVRPYGPPPPPGFDSIPLDGGLAILLLGAGFLGVKKLKENNK